MRLPRERLARAFMVLGLLLGPALGCRTEGGPTQAGSETHFLSFCDNASFCGEDLDCVCGVCTTACSSTASCSEHASAASCEAIATDVADPTCVGEQTTCQVSCSDEADCAELSGAHRCDRGACRRLAATCETGQTRGSQVVLLGDQFLANNGEITQTLHDLARESGALGVDDEYRDYSSSMITPFGGAADLSSQYDSARADGTPSLVILNVGGPNALGACEEPPSADCETLREAVDSAQLLWDRMQTDGVQAVVTFFYPDPVDPTLKAKFDVLRPLLRDACDTSSVECHFIDLRPTFDGQEQYLQPAGILPTVEGSVATAELIFSVMQQHCLAQ